jgi:hypothetical protein
MIIKKWDTTLNSGAGGWAEQYPKTVAQRIFDSAGTTAIFDSFDKIKPTYLPNSVFDSLYFYQGVTLPSSTKPLAAAAIANALNVTSRSSLGYYWVVTTAGNLTASSTASLETLYTKTCTLTNGAATITTADTSDLRVGMIVNGSNIPTNSTITAINLNGTQFTISNNVTPSGGSFSLTFSYNISTFITGGEERQVGSTVETVGLEVGDWFIVSRLSGVGSIASPFLVTFAPVNNTYELMGAASAGGAGHPGLVPGAALGQQGLFLRGDATWNTPTNTTYTVATANGTDAYKEKINLSGSDSSTDSVQIGVGATPLKTFSALTTNGNATMTVTATSGLLIGQLVTGAGIPENSLITAIVADTSITINNAATATGGGTLTASTFGLTIEQASDVITVKHADTSSAADLTSAARTYVTGLTFDTFGHVIGYSTGSESVVDTNTATAVDNILDGSNSGTAITYAPYAAAEAGKLSATSTLAAGTATLAYSGHFYANQIFEGATRVLTSQNTSKNIVGAANNATSNAVATNGNVFINHLEASTVTSFHNIIGSGATSVVSDASGNITISSTNTTYSDGNGIALTGTVFSVEAGEGLTQEASGLKMTYPVYHGDTLPTTNISANAIGL